MPGEKEVKRFVKERKGLALHPIDVATDETVEFLLRHISAKPLRLLAQDPAQRFVSVW